MSADSPRRHSRGIPLVVSPQIVCDRSIIDNVAGFINDVKLSGQPLVNQEDTIMWARFETIADISDPTYGHDWESEGNAAPLLLVLGYGLGVQVWAIPSNGEAVEVLSWRHGHVTALRILPTPMSSNIEMTNEPIDQFADKRPIIAICDDSPPGCGSQFSSVNFISLKDGSQIKTIKFKNNILDILANRTSVVITFQERIAIFDARNFEDRFSITTCYPSPGVNPNPVSLGCRWLAYSENRLIHSKRSGGGCDGDGVSSYTATVLNAAKSLGKGLKELGEQVAAGLTGSSSSGSFSKIAAFDSAVGDTNQPGVVTILDIKPSIEDVNPTFGSSTSVAGTDSFVAHFVAHLEAIVALEFDSSGMLLLTTDKRGHDFHIFRIQPHPTGSQLAAVHHLYVLHRGDTSAKVQNIAFSIDSRWVAVSTLRGTTHVFPINPYGGPAGIRTHASLHVVNRLSRFHRSAGLSADGRSSSPIFHPDSMTLNQIYMPYNNPTISPYPRPHIVLPLAQLRQPSVLGSPSNTAQNSYVKNHGRQRLSSLSDDNGKPLSVCAIFAKQRSWLLDPPNLTRETLTHKIQRKAVDSLFIMAGHGALIQYDLDIKLAPNIAKEKICDDTPIELEVEAKAQWNLSRRESSVDIQPPLASNNWLLKERNLISSGDNENINDEDRWLSQVEIVTHAGPHRRLWMGPQCVFKTYNTPSGAALSHIDVEAIEIGTNSSCNRPGPSPPLDVIMTSSVERSSVPVLIESGSYSSIEQSPKLMDRFRHEHMDSDYVLTHGESRLKEDLADAMRESPSVPNKETGLTPVVTTTRKTSIKSLSDDKTSATRTTNINKKGSSSNDNDNAEHRQYSNDINEFISSSPSSSSPSSSSSTKINNIPLSSSSLNVKNINFEQFSQTSEVLIEKVVNPLGIVTTRTRASNKNELDAINLNPNINYVIHENCDEALFRPVVTVIRNNANNDKKKKNSNSNKHITCDISNENNEFYNKLPEPIGTELVVPVIEKFDNKKKSIKLQNVCSTSTSDTLNMVRTKRCVSDQKLIETKKFDELSLINKNYKPNEKTISKEVKENDEEVKILSGATKMQKISKASSVKKNDEIIAKKEEICHLSHTKITKESKEEGKIKTDGMDKVDNAYSLEEKLCKIGISKNDFDITAAAVETKSGNDVFIKNETCSSSSKNKCSNISEKYDKNILSKLLKTPSDSNLTKISDDTCTQSKIKPVLPKPNKNQKSSSEQKSTQKEIYQMEMLPNDNVMIEKSSSEIKSDSIVQINDCLPKSSSSSSGSQKNSSFKKEILSTQNKNINYDLIDDTVSINTLTTSDNEKTKCIKQPKQQMCSMSSVTKQQSSKVSTKKSQKISKSILDETKTEVTSTKEKIKNESEKVSSDEDWIKQNQFQTMKSNQSDKTFDSLLNSSSIIKSEDLKKQSKSKHTRTLPLESFDDPPFLNLSDDCLPSLSPSEPFEIKFDEYLHFKNDCTNDHISLINFSPTQEKAHKSEDIDTEQYCNASDEIIHLTPPVTTKQEPKQKIKKSTESRDAIMKSEKDCLVATYDDKQSNEKYKNSPTADTKQLSSSSFKHEFYILDHSKQSSQHKNLSDSDDVDEQNINLSSNCHKQIVSTSSSEEAEECEEKIHRTKISHNHSVKLTDDDEELRPLISGENSACSVVFFSDLMEVHDVNRKNDNETKPDDEIDFEISKNVIEKPLLDSSDTEIIKNIQPNLLKSTLEMDLNLSLNCSDMNLLKENLSTTMATNTKFRNNDENITTTTSNVVKQNLHNSSSNNNLTCCDCTQTSNKKKSKKKKR